MMGKRVWVTMVLMFSAGVASGETITFRNGVNGYAGTADTSLYGYVGGGSANRNFGGDLYVSVAGQPWYPTTTAAYSGLLAFRDLIGSGANQVPAGARINSVTMTLNGGGSTAMLFLPMNTAWVEGNSVDVPEDGASCFAYRRYQSSGEYVSGVDTWGIEPGASAVGPCGGDYTGSILWSWNPATYWSEETFDLTSYVDGDLSKLATGFYLAAEGAWKYSVFKSSEYEDISNRPLLTVDYTVVPEPISLILFGAAGAIGLCRRRRK
jgi:hypothetical protein